MKADVRFKNLSLEFWSNVKLISQKVGYTVRRKKGDKSKKNPLVPTAENIRDVYATRGLDITKVLTEDGNFTEFGELLHSYFIYRAAVLRDEVEPKLMNVAEAKEIFEQLRQELDPKCPLPENKQSGGKKTYAYLTGIVNMIMEANLGGLQCNYNPMELTSITKDNFPVRTLSRRVDGAFPDTVNPFAIWEIKEYYYTKTFGSRVADGVYETLLDSVELREIEENLGQHVEHYLFLDDYYTWWECGLSYLCRIIDMLHMGVLTEVLFGREVVENLPMIASDLATKYHDVVPVVDISPVQYLEVRKDENGNFSE